MSSAPLPDSEHAIAARPGLWRDLAILARFDRPIGWWLLFWPCAFAIGLAGGLASHWWLFPACLVGAIAMRGAGCVYNDIVDRELDAQVARTRDRPLASGRVSLRVAWGWLAALSLVGLGVLLMLPWRAQIIALASLALVAAYPFMKRITWWPQLWLGLVFSWGALVGGAAVREAWPEAAILWLYAGCVFWVVGYDTIYALQDIEDDAMVGIRSSARAMGARVRGGVALCYALALAGWSLALWQVRPEWVALVALVPAAAHLGWQVAALRREDAAMALRLFRANRFTGLLVALACVTVGSTA